METSILSTIKKLIGIDPSSTVFDTDIIIHINSVFSTLQQLGVGPEEGFFIEDKNSDWDEYVPENANAQNMIKTYMYLSVKLLFDPPTTSFAITSLEKQKEIYEGRISLWREWELDPVDPLTKVVILDAEL